MKVPDSPAELYEQHSSVVCSVLLPEFDEATELTQKVIKLLGAELTQQRLTNEALYDLLMGVLVSWFRLNRGVSVKITEDIEAKEQESEVDPDDYDSLIGLARIDTFIRSMLATSSCYPPMDEGIVGPNDFPAVFGIGFDPHKS